MLTIEKVEGRLTAIMAEDVLGYSRHIFKNDADTLGRLRACWHDLLPPLTP
jgi:hypothetical protein